MPQSHHHNAYNCQARTIHFFIVFVLTLLQPTLVLAASFEGQLKGVTISDPGNVNAPPKAIITYTQNGSTYTFDGSGSTDSDGSLARYKWDFGDGGIATTAVAQHQFQVQGETATVTLSIIDNKGAVALTQVTLDVPVLYEDAEDGSINRWTIYDNDPPGAGVSNVFDDVRNSRVIDLAGGIDASNAFKLLKNNGALWGNTKNFVIQWSSKFAYDYTIYIDCQTSAGHRYLKYTSADANALGTGETVSYGLGTATRSGQWKTITRDLSADLNTAQPGTHVTSVDAFMIRGTGRVDDILLK